MPFALPTLCCVLGIRVTTICQLCMIAVHGWTFAPFGLPTSIPETPAEVEGILESRTVRGMMNNHMLPSEVSNAAS
eukprot:943997-Pyramimonas_sp.AAC.1